MLKKQFYKNISKNITYIKKKHINFFLIYIKIADVLEITLVVTDLMNCHGFAYMNCHQIDWFSVISQPHRAAA